MSTNKPESQDSMNIYQKLAKVRKAVEVVRKNKQGYGYTYVSDDELLSKITGLMDKYHLTLLPGISPGTMEYFEYNYVKTKVNKQTQKEYDEHNSEIIVKCDMFYTWVNDDNPEETIAVPWGMIGQQTDASQAFGSGLTYSMRYFLLKYFSVSTPEYDPDAWRSKQREAAEREEREIASQIVAEFDAIVRGYLSENQDKSKDVGKFCATFVKGGDYTKIVDPVLAAKMLDSFKKTFLNKGE